MVANLAGMAITGMGAICPIGLDVPSVRESLRTGRSGFGEITTFSTEGLRVHHAAQVRDYDPSRHFSTDEVARLDRTGQLAIIAARQAIADAGLSRDELVSGKVALIMGICAGGVGDGGMPPSVPAQRVDAETFFGMSHYAQTQAVAADLGITGPCLTVSTACASSTSALASALTLLEAGRVEKVVVGGADAYSLSIYAGFYALGAMCEQPTSPFSVDIGVTFGEGAGCIVIESAESAARRQVHVHGMLLACGNTSDAHHITSPHPSGEGLRRAMQLAIDDAELTLSSIQYINAHGTGTLDNDVTETLAIRSLYQDQATPPPTSSTKSYFGHTLGAAGILEFISSLIGLQAGFLPPTLNFKTPRPGCTLDYVQNTPRVARFDTFLSSSAAFGGVNSVAIGARANTPMRLARIPKEIVVSGLGIISPIGLGVEEFHISLQQGKNGIVPIDRFDAHDFSCRHAGQIKEFSPRNLAPMLDVRRMDYLTRYASIAATLAIKDAGLTGKLKSERIGLHVALTRGPVGAIQAFQENLISNGIVKLSAKYFPMMVLSTVAGQVAQTCRIKGANFTFVDGVGAGLQALAHASDYLALHPELDALVVIAADELHSLSYRMFDLLGLLATGVEAPELYAHDASGLVLGEGAVAMVLERTETMAARNGRAYGSIAGMALGSEGRADQLVDPEGIRLDELARQALQQAGGAPDIVYGLARGAARHDQCEANALLRLLAGTPAPLVCLNGQLGVAEASCGLFAASAALLGLRHGEAYPSRASAHTSPDLPLLKEVSRTGDFRRALVLGSSEFGNSAALVFKALSS